MQEEVIFHSAPAISQQNILNIQISLSKYRNLPENNKVSIHKFDSNFRYLKTNTPIPRSYKANTDLINFETTVSSSPHTETLQWSSH